MRKNNGGHSLDVFFVLCVFLICAVSLLGMLFVGANVQKKINQDTEDNFYMRTSLLYISNKAKFYNETDTVSVQKFEGQPALVFKEKIDGIEYETKVYMYEGHLMELFSESGYEISKDSGTIITEISSFKLKELNSELIEVFMETPNGKNGSVIISKL